MFVFEVWAENQKILGNLNLVTAISSFLHLAFAFNLKYPQVYPLNCSSYWFSIWLLKGGQTVADILQRKFACYGSVKG